MKASKTLPAGVHEHHSTITITLVGVMTRALAGVLLLFLGCGTTSVTKVEVRERIDTLLVKGDTIRITAPSDTLFIERDSSLAPGAFTSVRAALDTTVEGVRVYLQYAYPPDRWGINIIQRDTVIRWTVRDSIIQRPYEVQVIPLWIRIGGVLMMAAMVVGLVVFLIKK